MSKVDDELTRRLRRAERPVDDDGLFEGLERRRSHRERVRKVQVGLLGFAVLAATAGGFAILREAFDTDKRNVGESPSPGVLSANGEIVFTSVAEGEDGEHLFLISQDGSGRRQITHGDTSDRLPAWSPDGREIVFVRRAESSSRLFVLDIDSGDVRAITPSSMGVYRPSWSPDGELIAFAGVEGDGSDIWLVRPDGSGLRPITDGEFYTADAPRWSVDGSTIAFTANLSDEDGGFREGWDVYLIGRDGSGLRNLTDTPDPERSESPIGWLTDGNLVLAESPGTIHSGPGLPPQTGRWLEVAPSGDVVRTVLEETVNAPDHLQEPRLSPDGRFAVFDSARDGTQEVWFVELASREFTRVTTGGGYGAAWQPVRVDSEPAPTPTPSVSPEPDGRDIGLGFPVCQVSELVAQFDGEGATDTAIVATRLGDDMRCPSNVQQAEAYVGIDIDRDGLVDGSFGPITCEVYYCRAFAAPDLDGDDGKRELLVVEGGGSVVGLGVYALGAEAGSQGSTEVVRIHIGEPDLVQTGFVTGEPARLFIGGDEGWSYRLRCEDHGVNRFLYQQRAFRPVDSTGPATVDETTLVYGHGRLDVFDAREPEQSTSDDPLGPQPAEVCGAPIPAI